MFDIGFLELVLVGIIGLIILGPERLPVAARTLGKWLGRARRLVSQFTQEIDKEIEIEELKAKLKKQGESLDINDDVRKIQETVSQALSEAELDSEPTLKPHSGEFEPLPRQAPDNAFSAATPPKQHTPPLQNTVPSTSEPIPSAPSTSPSNEQLKQS